MRRLYKFVATLAVGLIPGLVVAGPLDDYAPVTDERLINPEPENWLQWRGNYESWGYSPLDQINSKNVKNLVPVWTYSTGVEEGHQAPPIVNNGVMFVSTPQNQVIALDAKSGDELWRYRRELPEELFQLHPTNRGVGLYGDKVYMATVDSCVVALNAKTGESVWEQCVEDWKTGYYMTISPLIAKGKVMVGVSGGEYGIRGFVVALDSETGEEAWKTYTIPGPGEPGHDTWPGDTWKHGGASVWIAGSYDPDTGLSYWGTGNAGPWMPDTRPGDNLYANSVLALDVETGELKGYHQYHWNEAWDWDEVSTPLLVDIERDGSTQKSLIHAGRNGYLWELERSDGPIDYVAATKYVRQDVFTSIDPETGRPEYDPERTPGVGKKASFCPSLWGGKDWPPEAYNPKTGLLYIPANENLCGNLIGTPIEYKAGELYIGVPIPEIGMTLHESAQPDGHIGEIQAWDLSSRKEVWKTTFKDQNWGPVTTTGGNLVFAGGTNDRYFRAFDATNGEKLWEIRTNSGVTAVPASYAVDGTQYIAVQSGWGVDAQRMQGALDNLRDYKTVVPQGGVIWVFALPQ